MSAPAFTPGPWSVGPWIDSMGGHVYRVISSASRKVSSVSVYGKRPDGTCGGRALKHGGHTKTVASEECEANAHLIAAAPELYEAAVRALNYIENTEGELDIKLDTGVFLRAAIAKARGEQS